MRAQRNTASVVSFRNMFFLILALLTVILTFIFFSGRVSAENSNSIHKYYTSYEIQPGDSLWTIADKYMTPECPDKAAFINQIKQTNHLLDNDIKAGNYLVIEYYSYEEL